MVPDVSEHNIASVFRVAEKTEERTSLKASGKQGLEVVGDVFL
jgi:hypothetical protein